MVILLRLILSSDSRSSWHAPEPYLKRTSRYLQEFFRWESLHSDAMAHTIGLTLSRFGLIDVSFLARGDHAGPHVRIGMARPQLMCQSGRTR